MKYSKIIEPKIKQLLEKNNISFSDFELDNCSVNIRDFIEKYTDFTIEEEPLYKKSSKFNKEENKIIVNVLEDEERKRFYIAYELGYALLESKTTNENSDEIAILVHELLAKEFAYSFLIPERLLKQIKEKVIIEERFSSAEITKSVKRIIIREMSKKLNIPMRLLQYKMNETENIWN
jgi:hypothetical protein